MAVDMTLRMKKAVSSLNKSALNKTLLAMILAGVSSNVMSHGYVEELDGGVASARGTLCKYAQSTTGEKNVNCGSVQWEPQSIEGPEGFPESGPADGQIASGGNSSWSTLNEQTSDRWIKNPISAGTQTFKWHFTANHVTRDWKYYITKADWNPNQPLTRDSFDLNPFCEVDGNFQQPPYDVYHECVVPEREGYQVILAVWDVGDTVNAFYNVIDVEFSGNNGNDDNNSNWSQGGTIIPTQDLSVGDKVYTRVFGNGGENEAYSTVLDITSADQGMATNWTHDLAEKINQEQTLIRAGEYDGQDSFNPTYGSNPIYLQNDSGLERVEISYEINTEIPDYELNISGLENEYTITGDQTALDLSLTAVGDIRAELKVVNHDQETLANYASNIRDGESVNTTLALSKSEAGHHMLVVVVKDFDGNLIEQNTLNFYLVGGDDSGDDDHNSGDDGQNNGDDGQTIDEDDYDYVFPRGLRGYTAGTKVLARDGNIYQCKPFPNSGYCVQWSRSANQYEPGRGSHWQMAWEKL
ncbi:N-acetylglucosamine-binding protein GbpA [Microbulbifer sp. CnH-101-G]|uniref:N-acetylglucosamine-binding protein GbpA n=1 Tax=Microbulbifer sp. CnH-101-G TaxID=3243393 RepID=UPI0040394B6F